METTKEELMDEAARHRVDTVDKKVDVAKAEAQETVDSVKIGAVNMAEDADNKWEDIKDEAGNKWEDVKDKASSIWEDIKDKAEEVGDKISGKAHEANEEVKDSMN